MFQLVLKGAALKSLKMQKIVGEMIESLQDVEKTKTLANEIMNREESMLGPDLSDTLGTLLWNASVLLASQKEFSRTSVAFARLCSISLFSEQSKSVKLQSLLVKCGNETG